MATIVNDRDVLLQAASPRNLSQDNILTPDQKPGVLQEYNTIIGEQSGFDSQADACGVSRTAYDAAITALTTYLGTLTGWNVIPGTNVAIVGTTFRQKFTDVYAAKSTLLYNIAQNVGTPQIVPSAATDVITTTASSVAITANTSTETDVATISYTAAVTCIVTLTITGVMFVTTSSPGTVLYVATGMRFFETTTSTGTTTQKLPGDNNNAPAAGNYNFSVTATFNVTVGTSYTYTFRAFNHTNNSTSNVTSATMRLEAIKR